MKKELLKAKMLLVALMMASATMFVACDNDDTEDPDNGKKPGQTETLETPKLFLERTGANLEVSWEYVSGATKYEVSGSIIGTVDEEGAVTDYAEADIKPLLAEPKVTENLKETLTIEKGYNYEIQVVATADGKENSLAGTAVTKYYVAAMMYEGGDLAKRVAEDIEEKAADEELEIRLIAGAEYTIESPLYLDLHPTTFVVKAWDEATQKYVDATAEDKRPNVAFVETGHLFIASGLNIDGVNFDCTAQIIEKPNTGVITVSPNQYEELLFTALNGSNELYKLEKPIVVKNTNVKNAKGAFFSVGENTYGVDHVEVDNCILQFASEIEGDGADLFCGYTGSCKVGEGNTWSGGIREVSISNSTVYNINEGKARLIRWGNADMNRSFSTETGYFKVTNCTIHSFACKIDNASNNTGKVAGYEVALENNIFYNVYALQKLKNGSATINCKAITNIISSPWWADPANDEKQEKGYYSNQMQDGVYTLTPNETEASMATCDSTLAFTGTEPTALDLSDDAKGGQNFTYSWSSESTAQGDKRWK